MSLFTTFGSFSIAAGHPADLPDLRDARRRATRRARHRARDRHAAQPPRADVPVRGPRLRPRRGRRRRAARHRASPTGWCSSWRPRSAATADVTITLLRDGSTSVVIAYAIGVLLTLAVVAFSAWRVSRMNIVTRDPQPARAAGASARRTRWLLGAVGARARRACCSCAGVSVERRHRPRLRCSAASSSASCRSRARWERSDRLVYTAAGLALVAWFVLPMSRWLLGDLKTQLLDLHPRRPRDRRRRELGDHVQRRRPAGRALTATARAHPPARAGPQAVDRVPARRAASAPASRSRCSRSSSSRS